MSVLGTVKDGVFSNTRHLHETIRKFEGKRIEISVKEQIEKRTLKQNAYLWGVVYKEIADTTGNTKEDIDHAMRDMFLVIDERYGIMITKSTKDLSIEELALYIERISAWYSEFFNLTFSFPEGEDGQ